MHNGAKTDQRNLHLTYMEEASGRHSLNLNYHLEIYLYKGLSFGFCY